MNKEQLQEKIEAYLNKTLSSEALIAFEQQLAEDEELTKEVFLVKDTNEAIEDLAIEEKYLPQLEELNKKYFTNSVTETDNVKATNRKPIMIVLAVVISLILGILAWKYLINTPNPTEQQAEEELIFASYYEPFAADELTRSGTDATTTYQEAIALYNNSDFDAAIPILEAEATKIDNQISAQILLANCYLSKEPKELQAAIDMLKPLSTDNTHSFTEIAQWYLALAYIENNQSNLAQPILQIIANKEIGKYPKMAKEILSKMSE